MRKAVLKYCLVASVAVATTLAFTHAIASPKKDRAEEREERREKRDEKREERREQKHAAAEDIKDDWKQKRKAWILLREERRSAWRDEARKKWGDLVERAAAREELRVHARRVARIERIKFLADATNKSDVGARADAALEKERVRFEARMNAIKSEGTK